MNIMGRFIKHIVIILSVALLTLTGCSKYKEIAPTSFKLESFSARGLRSIDLEMSIGVHNPVGQLAFSDMYAEIVLSGKVLGRLTLAPFTLQPKSDAEYKINGRVDLTNDISILQAVSYVRRPELLKDAKLNVTAKVQLKNGLHKTLTFEDIPVEKLLKQL